MNNSIISLLRSNILATKGKFFTVTFVKKDGSTRTMNCRLGVKKHLKSEKSIQSTTAHIEKYVTVFDVEAMQYRTINLETLKTFKGNGITLTT